ncbi:unnamed protein product [Lupinus luteus]|uniref:RRM domain-containing protein n=1 Tax=Lupinus luteus TaxID=3873 RepID=A0AAV1YN13_LUPLU
MAALHSLNGVKFDPQSGSVLHIELARSNSRRKHMAGGKAYVVIDKRSKAGEADDKGSSSDDGEFESDPDESSGSGSDHDTKLINIYKYFKYSTHSLNLLLSLLVCSDEDVVASGNAVEQHQKGADGGPCSTLFIANLGPNCTEDELKQAFSVHAGFNLVKMRSRGGMPVAFADFEETDQATKVMEQLQGSLLPSSDRGGMHIEYPLNLMVSINFYSL